MRLEQWAPWVLSVLSLPGPMLLRWKWREGWLLNALMNGVYMVYNAVTHQWGFVPLNVAFAVITLGNYQAWGVDEPSERENKEMD